LTDALRDATSIQPLLVVHNAAAAIDFYKRVFGAVERLRLMHSHRVGHAILALGTSELVVLDEFPEAGIGGPRGNGADERLTGGPRLLVQVTDVDGVLARAEASGATLLHPAEDQWWGVRSGAFRDPFGHRWSVHTVIENISGEEMQRRADELGLYPPPPEPKAR
jgi:PhnB protein